MNTFVFHKKNKAVAEGQHEEGFVLVMTLCFLVIMSMLGVFATQISNIEIQTSTNNEKFQTSFTLGEAVAVESVALLKNETVNNLKAHTPDLTGLPYQPWLGVHRYFEGIEDLTLPDYTIQPDGTAAGWTSAGEVTSPTAMNQQMNRGGILPPGFTAGTDMINFAVQDTGRSSTSDLSEGATEIRNYYLYGNYTVGRGSAYPGFVLLEMGYRYQMVEDESAQM